MPWSVPVRWIGRGGDTLIKLLPPSRNSFSLRAGPAMEPFRPEFASTTPSPSTRVCEAVGETLRQACLAPLYLGNKETDPAECGYH